MCSLRCIGDIYSDFYYFFNKQFTYLNNILRCLFICFMHKLCFLFIYIFILMKLVTSPDIDGKLVKYYIIYATKNIKDTKL